MTHIIFRYTAAILFILSHMYVFSQTAGSNYVKTMTVTREVSYEESVEDITLDNNLPSVTDIEYFDGLGRPIEKISGGITTSNKVCSLQSYDNMGRPSVNWLPIPVQTLDYVQPSAFAQESATMYNDEYGYSQNTYDSSGRLGYTSTAGSDWYTASKGKGINYGVNTSNSVRRYRAPIDSVSLVKDGYYPYGALTYTETIDEDGHSLRTYTDLVGRKVLERRNGDNDTYFVYNDRGQLRYVLSPEYQNAGFKSLYSYEYRYDMRGRIVKKIMPGCEYTQYWYDNEDRMVFMQDATLRDEGRYRFYLYDVFGRQVIQGTCSVCDRHGRVNIATPVCPESGFHNTGYMLDDMEQFDSVEIEMADFYDSHDFLWTYSGLFENLIDSMDVWNSSGALTFHTGRMQKTSNGETLLTAYYYDYRGRISDVREIGLGGLFTNTHNEYTFTNKPKRTVRSEYCETDEKFTVITEHTYHQATDLLLSTDLTFRYGDYMSKSQRIKSLEYDEIGRVKSITRGGNAGTVAYEYDIHGWIKKITSDSYTQRNYYADGYGTSRYNGNISSMDWRTPEYDRLRGYKFTYDEMNRLQEATYGEDLGMYHLPNRYDEKVLAYNANGSIERFQRRGLKDDGIHGKIDNLTLVYNGNMLFDITDDANPVTNNGSFQFEEADSSNVDYEYNDVGSLTKDINKGITSIAYDRLNNPKRILFYNGNDIIYNYGADGRKLVTEYNIANDNSTVENTDAGVYSVKPLPTPVHYATKYNGNTIYSMWYYSYGFDKYLFDGGYVDIDGDTIQFHYYTKDHLGSNRTLVHENGTVEQVVHYYPFGGTYADAGVNWSLQMYKYNGKELDRMHGLDWYDYGARMYDAVLAGWTSMDPLAEEYYHVSPYVYCLNNPVNAIDPDGRYVESIWDVASFAAGVTNLVENLKNRNYGKALIDIGGLALDGLAMALPAVPGGAGAAIKAKRISEKGGYPVYTVKKVHGNSRLSTKAQHSYDIIDTKENKIVKVGVSGGKIRKDGKSVRAEIQVRKWNKEAGEERYKSIITKEEPVGFGARERILDYEKKRTDEFREQLDKNKHKRP
ncbi:MAG: hypothetical protein IJ421_02185 [Prevotella sp.]|nr:hypothetical protein [Prevotella sp.]